MKVYSVLLIIVFSLTPKIFPQVQFIPHTITTDAKAAEDVYAVDVDGDGDVDVLSASVFDDKIAWYENDGNENFISHTITSTADGACVVYTKDVDGDGDIDVLSASNYGVAWYENDGNENFTTHNINASANSSESVYAVDVDSDGDIDVLSAYYLDDNITWYENDGNENFIPHAITNSVDMTTDVYAVDVDSDGDMDVLSASCGEYPSFISKICWYKNDGNENFTQFTIIANASYFLSVHAEDVDRDGDMDVLSASSFDDKIAWYENDGNENFTSHTITTSADAAFSVYAADIDGDGDMDVLSASLYDDKIAWYENDGNENFTSHTITTDADGPRSVFAIDVDGDGYMDVLSASRFDSTIAWYENSLLSDTLHVPGEYPTIQAAIDEAINGDIVLVAEDIYFENINFKGKAITVTSNFLIDGNESHISNTIINGSQPSHPDSASVVYFISGEDTTSVLYGLTITGGKGSIYNYEGSIRRMGGGIYLVNSGARIENNIIEFNSIDHTSDSWGGGIGAVSDVGPNYIVENNVIRNNNINTPNVDYNSLGGGAYLYTSGYAKVVNNKIIENKITAPTGYGGGLSPYGGANFVIDNNFIDGNEVDCSTGGSGGIDIYYPHLIRNNLIVNNSAPAGGGLYIEIPQIKKSSLDGRASKNNSSLVKDDVPIIENNTIADNTAVNYGGGVAIIYPIVPQLMNCIVWGNYASSTPQIYGVADVQYSDIESGYTGTGNIDSLPLFDGSEYYLLGSTSPCIDAGNPDPIYFDVGAGGNALPPAQGSVLNDMGHCGGPASLWYLWDWPMPVEDNSLVVSEFILMQNYPNPFNPTTTIRYMIPKRALVTIKIYDILGDEITTLVNEEKTVGNYEVEFIASNLSSGVYFYQLTVGDFIQTKKMILLR